MILHDAYRISNLDLVQFLNKVKYIQVNKFDSTVYYAALNQLLHYNACAYALKRNGGNVQLPPVLKLSKSMYTESHVRITVAPYGSDLLVLLFPGENAFVETKKLLIDEFTLQPFSPTGLDNDSPEFIAWRTVFDNMVYASPSNCMFSVVLTPRYDLIEHDASAELSTYMQDNIQKYCKNLTVDDIVKCAELTFPTIRSNMDLTTLEETLNAIRNEL